MTASYAARTVFGEETPNASSAAGPAMSPSNITSLTVASVTPLALPGGVVQPRSPPPVVVPVLLIAPVAPAPEPPVVGPVALPELPVEPGKPVVPVVPIAPPVVPLVPVAPPALPAPVEPVAEPPIV